MLRFSLDRNFLSVDTSSPDSGDRGSAKRTRSRKIRFVPSHEASPGFRKKFQREVTLRAFSRAAGLLLSRLSINGRKRLLTLPVARKRATVPLLLEENDKPRASATEPVVQGNATR